MAERNDHITVLREAAVDALVTDPEGIYFDCTFGRGGHALELLQRLSSAGRLIAMDRDPQAVEAGQQLALQDPRLIMHHGRFSTLKRLAEQLHVTGRVTGILFDLGVSSPQLDQPQRGFSFLNDGPLDMRMEPGVGETAAEWLNRATERQIADVLFLYGEERFSRRMARAIVEARGEQPLTSTRQLADIVMAANPAWERDRHPATRAFQAIRIQINHELEELSQGLEQALQVLAMGGRLAAISFHSLEDRTVKKFISLQIKGDSFPRGLPIPASLLRPKLKAVGKPARADDDEVNANPRARSAIMRVAEKIA